jgi:hypothetical protein
MDGVRVRKSAQPSLEVTKSSGFQSSRVFSEEPGNSLCNAARCKQHKT